MAINHFGIQKIRVVATGQKLYMPTLNGRTIVDGFKTRTQAESFIAGLKTMIANGLEIGPNRAAQQPAREEVTAAEGVETLSA